jgi:hypothetical protein
MDPFLEDPVCWPDVHASLIVGVRDQLAGAVGPDYYVRIEERVYVTSDQEDPGYPKLVPDVFLTLGGSTSPQPRAHADTAAISPSVEVEELLEPEVHDRYLEVRDARSHEVVTAVEVLSPANKVQASRGREAMLEKRKLLWGAGASWIEIDLLRAGERENGTAGRSDYCVFLLRHGSRRRRVWFVGLRDALPTVAVPMRPPHADVALELQRVWDLAYDRAHYERMTDYTRPVLPPPLKPADAAWVHSRLAEWAPR